MDYTIFSMMREQIESLYITTRLRMEHQEKWNHHQLLRDFTFETTALVDEALIELELDEVKSRQELQKNLQEDHTRGHGGGKNNTVTSTPNSEMVQEYEVLLLLFLDHCENEWRSRAWTIWSVQAVSWRELQKRSLIEVEMMSYYREFEAQYDTFCVVSFLREKRRGEMKKQGEKKEGWGKKGAGCVVDVARSAQKGTTGVISGRRFEFAGMLELFVCAFEAQRCRVQWEEEDGRNGLTYFSSAGY